ncbi:MAG: beta-propeller domain-containing protein [Limisphaerales bacterium]
MSNPVFIRAGFLSAILGLAAAALPAPAAPTPRIQSIRAEDASLVIAAEVPAYARRLLLEGSSRGDLRGWVPRASLTVEPGATQAVFRLPRTLAMEMFRVRGDDVLPLNPSLFRGTNRFAGRVVGEGTPGQIASGSFDRVVGFESLGRLNGDAAGAPASDAALRPVQESDIWRVHGDRLYFFNPHRGLQVMDISDTGAPDLLATLPLAGAGEQMYLLGGDHVVLLLRPPCRAWGVEAESAVVIVDVRGDRAVEVARVPVPGQIVESRLVGSALYLATQAYRPRPSDGSWENFLSVQPLDLADPARPVVRPGLEYSGWPTALQATADLLLVAEQAAHDQTRVRVLDISDPQGAVTERTALPVPGRVADKFKLHARDGIVTVIAETWQPARATVLRTFGLRPGTGHDALGSLEVGRGESLFGTRFDGNRAYIVTFLRVDPLWIIDLSDPARPRVAGELEIPGWSNYLHPLGDRLLTVGIDDANGWRAAVQLFDVSDPSKPALLGKVPLGEGWSYSEANSDEKALGVFPDEGLVLLPFSSSRNQGVQLIDLGRDSLTARGVIAGGSVVPRRSTLHRNRVLAISPRELVSVNVANRSEPQVQARLELAYPVDRVLLAGGFLLEFSGPELRVRTATEGSPVLNQILLGEEPVLGALVRSNRLHLLQGHGQQVHWNWSESPPQWLAATNTGRLQHSVYDLASLPSVSLRGRAEAGTEGQFSAGFEALEPLPGLLVWAGESPGHYGWPYGPIFTADFLPVVRPAGGMMVGDASFGIGWLPFWGGHGGQKWHLAVDVQDEAQPAFRSQVTSTNQTLEASKSFRPAPGLLYFSTGDQESELIGTNTWVSWHIEATLLTNTFWRTNISWTPVLVTTTNRTLHGEPVPAVRVRLPAATAATAGYAHSLVLASDGAALAWGLNDDGQLGDVRHPSGSVPYRVAGDSPFTQLAAGTALSLARDAAGHVWQWGRDWYLPLPPGPGQTAPPVPPANSPSRVGGLDDVVAVTAGHHFQAALRRGVVWTWGRNHRGQLGTGGSSDRDEPWAVAGLPSVLAVSAGGYHALALTAAGEVWGWGWNADGQVIPHGVAMVESPVLVPLAGRALAVVAGGRHSAALLEDGSVATWGDGQATRTDSGPMPDAGRVPGLPAVTRISAGGQHTLALTGDGRAFLVGSFPGPNGGMARELVGLPPLRDVASGRNHALALAQDGSVVALGESAGGRLGEGEPLTVAANFWLTNVFTWTEWQPRETVELVTEVQPLHRQVATTNHTPILRWFVKHHLQVLDYREGADDPLARPPVELPGRLAGATLEGQVLFATAERSGGTTNVTHESVAYALAYDEVSAFLMDTIPLANLSQGESALTLGHDGRLLIARGKATDGEAGGLESWSVGDDGKFLRTAAVPLAARPSELHAYGPLGLVRTPGGISLLDLRPKAPRVIRQATDASCSFYLLQRGDGSLTDGAWLPASEIGAIHLAP